MVDYKYKDLYNKPHIDKQIKIIACDYVGYGVPDSKYPEKLEYEGKVYLDAETNFYYKCRKSGVSYAWEKVEHEYELLVFKNSDIDWENFELSENLCSESELRFGCCEASVLKFRIHNTFVSLKDKWMAVTEVLEGHSDSPFQFGRYKVFSDVPTADRLYRDVTAYDAMYDIINFSAINWYNTILPERNSKVTMRQFRTSFVNYFGLEQEEITLVNDDMIVEKTIQVEEGVEIENETEHTSIIKESSLSGKDVITSICEINGCFGSIGRNGKFHYVYLNQDIMGLYPSNTLFPDHAPDYLPQEETGHLYPQEPKSASLGTGKYKSCQYEDFICRRITKLQIRQEENDIGKIWPEGEKRPNDNCYIIENNFLVYGKSSDELRDISKNIFDKISDIVYRPFSAECVGNPCLEVGDAVRFPTRYELVESYILSRTLKGIQGLVDTYGANGAENYSEKINGIHSSIIQLKSKANILKRTIEETRSELMDSDAGLNSLILQTAGEIRSEVEDTKNNLQTKITQNAESITAEAERAKESEEKISGAVITTNENLSSKIEQTAESITFSVDKKIDETKRYADGKVDTAKTELSSKIEQTAESITYNVSATYETKTDAGETKRELQSSITQTAESITQEITDRTNGQTELSSKIEQTVKSIDMSVDNGDTSATLNLLVTKENGSVITGQAKEIKFSGLVSFENLAAGDGKTIINGSNIKTGTIDTSIVNILDKLVMRIMRGSEIGERVVLHLEWPSGQTDPNIVFGDKRFNNIVVKSSISFESEAYVEKTLYVEGAIYADENIRLRSDERIGITKDGPDNDVHYLIDYNPSNKSTGVGMTSIASGDGGPTVTLLRGNSVKLGTTSGTIVTSDERLKNSFKPLDEFDEVYMNIEPCAFKYNEGTSGRYHFGTRAQSVKEALENYGYTTQDFGGFAQMSDDPENEDYCGIDDPMGLIYTEFVMWNTHMIQKLYKKIDEQQAEIDSLKESVSFLIGKD